MAGTKAASHQEQQQHEERENNHSTGRKGRNQLWWIRDPIGRGRNPLEWWGTTHLLTPPYGRYSKIFLWGAWVPMVRCRVERGAQSGNRRNNRKDQNMSFDHHFFFFPFVRGQVWEACRAQD
jgi:hypothetical protein